MRFAYWITKATNTHLEYVILIAFRCNNGYANATHCYVIRKLPVLFITDFSGGPSLRCGREGHLSRPRYCRCEWKERLPAGLHTDTGGG